MKTFTNADLRKFKPCYHPNQYLEEGKEYTVIDILDQEAIPFEDRLWVVLRTDFISERIMRLFAVWAYRQTLQWVKNPDPRSIEAANVAERFAEGRASVEELATAQSAAWSAAWSAGSAGSAAQSAAWSAVWSAVRSAQSAAWSAVWSAAQSAAWSAQTEKLKEMIIAGIETGDTK